MVVLPFVEVLRSWPPARSLNTAAGATFARYVRSAARGGGSRSFDQAHTSASMMCAWSAAPTWWVVSV